MIYRGFSNIYAVYAYLLEGKWNDVAETMSQH
jgi:hypothetical protein